MDQHFICDKLVCEAHAEDIYDEADDYRMIGFSDHGDDPERYLLLERAYSFDEQDVALGMDTYSVEYVSPEAEVIGYGLCEAVERQADAVRFRFKPNPDGVASLTIDLSRLDRTAIPSDFDEQLRAIIG